MEIKSTNIGGKVIKHKQVISYNTVSTFPWKQRLQILFGKRVHIYSAIFTMNNKVDVVDTAAMTIIGEKKPPIANQAEPIAKEKELMKAV